MPSIRFEEQPGSIADFDQRYTPQFYLGNPEAKIRADIALSMKCGMTRRLYKGGIKNFINKVRARNDALIIFHHLVRAPAEMILSEILLSLAPAYYGPVFLAAIQFFSENDKNPSGDDLLSIVKHLNIPKDQNFDRDAARNSSALMNVYLLDKEGVTGTPALAVNGGSWHSGVSPETFNAMLRGAGYDV